MNMKKICYLLFVSSVTTMIACKKTYNCYCDYSTQEEQLVNDSIVIRWMDGNELGSSSISAKSFDEAKQQCEENEINRATTDTILLYNNPDYPDGSVQRTNKTFKKSCEITNPEGKKKGFLI